MLLRVALLVVGIPFAFAGLGLVAAFGVFAFIGMPLLVLGISMISASTRPNR